MDDEEFTLYYEQLKKLDDSYFNGEVDDLKSKIDYLIKKSFLLQHLVMIERIDRVNQGVNFTIKTETASRSVSKIQDSIFEIMKSQEKIEYLLKRY